MRFHKSLFLVSACVVGGLAAPCGLAAETPPFPEVFGLVRSNLTGVSEMELNQAAVRGLLQELGERVSFVETNAAPAQSDAPVVAQSTVYDSAFAYARIGRVQADLAVQLREALERLQASNQIKGLVIDLRYADGEDYKAAAAAADLFQTVEKPLLSWAEQSARATAKTNALTTPTAVLVNRQTAAAAEALAGMLRQTDVALLIGSTTAGRASLYREFALTGGQRLRLAASPVMLGNGVALGTKGLTPDIVVTVSAEDERTYFADAYAVIAKTAPILSGTNTLAAGSTNRPARRRINEAELVRMQREGADLDADATTATKGAEATKPLVTDPALVRALDLLKGLAVVQKLRAP